MVILFSFLFCLSAHAASVTIAWDASPDAVDGYYVCYGTNSGIVIDNNGFTIENVNKGNYQFTNTVGPGTLTNRVEGLDCWRRYWFAVQAFKGGEVSEFSNEVQWSGAARADAVLVVKRKIKMRFR